MAAIGDTGFEIVGVGMAELPLEEIFAHATVKKGGTQGICQGFHPDGGFGIGDKLIILRGKIFGWGGNRLIFFYRGDRIHYKFAESLPDK